MHSGELCCERVWMCSDFTYPRNIRVQETLSVRMVWCGSHQVFNAFEFPIDNRWTNADSVCRTDWRCWATCCVWMYVPRWRRQHTNWGNRIGITKWWYGTDGSIGPNRRIGTERSYGSNWRRNNTRNYSRWSGRNSGSGHETFVSHIGNRMVQNGWVPRVNW